VVYASSSSALATGSALTFDGTNLGVGTASPSGKLQVQATNSGIFFDVTTAYTPRIVASGALSDLQLEAVGSGGNLINKIASGASAFVWNQGAGELMKLNSTGLGIGTSSPTSGVSSTQTVLEIANGNVAALSLNNTSAKKFTIYSSVASSLAFYDVTAGANRMTLDTSGNLGLGVTPSAWGGVTQVFEFGSASSSISASLFQNGVNDTWFNSNAYFNGTNWIYKNSGTATQYHQAGGAHEFYKAASGTAGGIISWTQAATLTADGNFLVGVTSGSFRLSSVVASGANRDIFGAQIEGASNGFTIKWNHSTTTTRVNIQNLPTSATGLASGDLYVLAGALMVA
jgi:hypothetical protein